MLGKRAEVIEMCSGAGESSKHGKNDQLLRRDPNAWQFKNFLNAISAAHAVSYCNTVQYRNEMLKPTPSSDPRQPLPRTRPTKKIERMIESDVIALDGALVTSECRPSLSPTAW